MASSRMLQAVNLSSTTAEYGSLFLAAIGLGTIAYLYRDSLSCSLRRLVNNDAGCRVPKQDLANSRCIVRRMQLQSANCVVFFGSQSGNAQDMATKIAREAQSRYGLTVLVADLDDYDYDGLHAWPADALAVFVLASYGDGEPTDNAQRFFDFMAVEQQPPLTGTHPCGACGTPPWASGTQTT
ncbi:unnamed protein product [Parascedosporium putredinis]|uniref:Flavodoxin-like domain-containing protein n=1 Tax=Parascedosporium putredinis TaxID=1442378 RepID=A0A9P1H9X4_9PEZI|nr:unnamed protein product [Parascedosporium putredinis]CAI8002270.1 unnamed protein product [Parascedosporium putredinis]